jgi:hypothetical protein
MHDVFEIVTQRVADLRQDVVGLGLARAHSLRTRRASPNTHSNRFEIAKNTPFFCGAGLRVIIPAQIIDERAQFRELI